MLGRKTLLVCFLVLSVAAFASASNMGFKITIPLVVGGSNQNWFSLPYNNSYADAAAIKTELGTNVGSVWRWNVATNSYTYYTSSRLGTNFTIESGIGYMVNVTAASTYNWVVVGSHDPSKQVPLIYGGSNQNWLSVPYHTTAADAATFKTELGNDGLTVGSVWRWNVASNSFTYYTSSRLGTNFSIVPGVSYMVNITADPGTNNWTPEHY